MTTYSRAPGTTWGHSSDATFREWGKAISDGLAAVGLVQTSDTGQINWSTVTRPGSNADGGYEVWRFNDTEQASLPIFIKITYGTASSTSYARVVVQVATGPSAGSDGSGGLTGNLSTARSCTNILPGLSKAIKVSGGDGYLAVAASFSGTAGANAFRLIVERLRDADGDPSARGLFFSLNSQSTGAVDVFSNGSWTGYTTPSVPIAWPGTYASSVKSGDYVLFAGATPFSGDSDGEFSLPTEPTLLWGAVSAGIGAEDSTVTVPRWDGNTHTYICTGIGYATALLHATNELQYILWE